MEAYQPGEASGGRDLSQTREGGKVRARIVRDPHPRTIATHSRSRQACAISRAVFYDGLLRERLPYVTPLAATFATLAIFVLPGLLLVAALGGEGKVRLSLLEQIYLSLAGSFLFSGWVSFVLAELGLFSPSRTALIVVAGAALTIAVSRRRLSLRPGASSRSELLIASALVAFSAAIYFPPFEHILGGRDPGVYVNAGFHLARDGRLVYHDPVVADIPREAWPLFFPDKELPPWDYHRYLGFRLESPESARVVAHGLHLYPVWIGTASALYQPKSGLYATPFFALLAVSGFFVALRRIFDLEVAAVASALLAVFQIQIWFARFPNSEMVVQFLFATSLLLFFFMEEKRSALAGFFAGLALGATSLARVETLLFAVPVALSHPAGAGVEVRNLEYTVPGRHEAFWDGTDQSGRQVASGIYFMQLTVNGQSVSRRMYVLK